MTTHAVRVEPLGCTLRCSEDQTILDACLRNAVYIPHACSSGSCGTCKATVLDGSHAVGQAVDGVLTEEEVSEGRVLLCMTRPTSDLVVHADVVPDYGIRLHPVRDYTACVVSMQECARETMRVVVELDRPMDFVAGQYVSIRVPGAEVRRAYSMANPPSDRRRIELHIRRAEGGLATDRWIFSQLQEGERFDISGPYGGFILRTDRAQPIIMVAGGTGLAPMKSMARHVLENGLSQEMHLYQGARTRADLYDVDFFSELAQRFPGQFHYRPCLSEEAWQGRQGLVTDVLTADFTRARGYSAYVCGPPPMVEAAIKALVSLRVASKDIFRENFYDQSVKAST